MYLDRYENPVSVTSEAGRDLYIVAVDKLLGAESDMEQAFLAVVEAEPGFALGCCGLARAHQIMGNGSAAQAAIAQANSLSNGLPSQQASHLNALSTLIAGKGAEAYRCIREHVGRYPRDVMVAQPCSSVFGLIGFSGQPGREAELLAYTASLLPHYGDDWWCLSQHAFSLCETGQTDRADAMIDRSLAINPRNTHGAHVRAHVYYETGEIPLCRKYLSEWLQSYDRKGILHGHLSWHVAVCALENGDVADMWKIIDADVVPGAAQGLPINVLTDTASIYYRANLAGETIPHQRWGSISQFAKDFFPNTGIGFVDVHAALAHAMAGRTESLELIIAHAAGPAADLVVEFAKAFRAVAEQKWPEAILHLTKAMPDHARIGGSRAQRDLLEYAMLWVLLKQEKADEATRMLALRRPVQGGTKPVKGL